jgi:hypothetical protein
MTEISPGMNVTPASCLHCGETNMQLHCENNRQCTWTVCLNCRKITVIEIA